MFARPIADRDPGHAIRLLQRSTLTPECKAVALYRYYGRQSGTEWMKLVIMAAESATPTASLALRGIFIDMISRAHEIGYDAVEFHIADSAEVNANQILQACGAHRISISSIGTGLAFSRDGMTLAHHYKRIRHRAVDRLRTFIELGGKLGSVVIVGLIKGLVPDSDDQSTYKCHPMDAVATCLPMAESYGATLVLEAVNRYGGDSLNTISEFVRFINRIGSKRLKVHIDTFHMNIEESRIGESIVAAGRNIGHVHVADSDRCFPSSGHYNFAEHGPS
jgi:sugar phosphate isomerase/epimerase